MTARDGFTRLVDTWLAEEGAPTTPDYLDLVLDRTSTTRQRPAWLSPGRWLPMATTLNPRAYSLPPVARYAVIAALLIVLALAAVALFAGTQQRRVPPPFGPAANGRIYFDVDGAIVATDPDGTGRQTVALGVTAVSAPYVSPDGTKLAFVAVDQTTVAGGSYMVADADGSNVRRISGDLRLDIDPTFNPTWSPDSTQLAFASFHQGYSELFIANADGSGVRAVGDRDLYARQNPEWSSSGDWIAFMAWPANAASASIAVVRPDGTDEHVLPTSAGAGQGFRGWQLWAPDLSNRLLYGFGARDDAEAGGFNLGDGIAVMNVDTGVETIVSDVPAVIEHRPAWSPDGTKIAFHFGEQIAVMNADGTGRHPLKDTLSVGSIGWSPDGQWIYGKSPSDLEVEAIDAVGDRAPILIKLGGDEHGVFTWQRTAP